MLKHLKKFGPVIITVIAIAGAFTIGTYIGYKQAEAVQESEPLIVNGEDGKPEDVDFSAFWKAWNMLEKKYVPTRGNASTTKQDMVWGAIEGLANAYGDPYTVFFPPKENKEFKNEISGNFEGLGMEVGMKDGIITVIAPLKNTPAEKAGIKSGDRILKIDDTPTNNMSVDEAVSMIRGKRGTPVRLTIFGKDAKQATEITVVRDVINLPVIDTELRKDGIFVISLYSFTDNSSILFRNAIKEFVNSKSNKLVLDLRGNPGGYLESAVDMASWFLPADKVIVKEDSGGKGIDEEFKSNGYNIFNNNLKMIILVDEGSASAAEILAGALQEHGIAKLVGTKTYGKGSVQELVPITPDTSLKVTIARWLTPKGISISDQGLKPDYEVKITEEDMKGQKDPQLDKAIELLK